MMKSRALTTLSFVCLVFLLGCSGSSQKIDYKMTLQNDGALKISGPDEAALGEIQRDSAAWQNLFPVYRMPADTDMKDFQKPQPGSYRLMGAVVIFKPDTPFTKGQSYFLRCFQFGEGKSSWDMLKSGKKLGSQAYIDLTFKK
jgi:hypothetical protein